MKKEVSIFWFRRDLRLFDNNALFNALTGNYPVLPIFIFDPDILDKLSDKQDKRVEFIRQSLEQLNIILKPIGSSIYVLHEKVEKAFDKLSEEYLVREVYANHDYEPYAINRDLRIKSLLESKNITFKTFKDQVIFEKSEVMKSDGTPYTIFTPYSRKWKEKFYQQSLNNFPSELHFSSFYKCREFLFPSLNELGFEETSLNLPEPIITEERIRNYQETRNLPSVEGTSQISVQLRFGTVSVRHLVKLALNWNEQWLNELILREFFMMILFQFPNVISESFKKKYDKIQWRNNEKGF